MQAVSCTALRSPRVQPGALPEESGDPEKLYERARPLTCLER